MPNPSQAVITVPRERQAQLLSIMDKAGARTISETIGLLIRSYVEQGRIEHTFPGVTINKLADGVAIRFEGNELTGYSFEGARVLAETIRAIASGEQKSSSADLDHDFAVERRGNGIKVSVPLTGTPKGYPNDLALELAELIAKAAE